MSHKLTQSELEQPAKVYQLQSLEEKMTSIELILREIRTQTNGVVTYAQMKEYVDEKIKEKISAVVKLGWTIVALLVGNIITLIFK